MIVDVDPDRPERCRAIGHVDIVEENVEDAITLDEENVKSKTPKSIGLIGSAADVYHELSQRGMIPDVVTDQTSAHEALFYVPSGLSIRAANQLRAENPEKYKAMAMDSMAKHVRAMLAF